MGNLSDYDEKESGDLKSVQCSTEEKTIKVLEGPILFTSPHGMTVMRYEDGEYESHSREKYATSVALQLAEYTRYVLGGQSFIIWNEEVAVPKDKSNLDPNYLKKRQFKDCPFHQGVLELKKKFSDVKLPMINFDCHARATQKEGIILEVGIAVFRDTWVEVTGRPKSEVKKVDNALKEEFERVFKRWNKIRVEEKSEKCKIPFTVDMDPYFSGWWGGGLHTLSHQCTLEGIVGVQLEIPPVMRRLLVNNLEFLKDFGEAIVRVYEKCFLGRKKVMEIVKKMQVEMGEKVVFQTEKYLNETVKPIDEGKRKIEESSSSEEEDDESSSSEEEDDDEEDDSDSD